MRTTSHDADHAVRRRRGVLTLALAFTLMLAPPALAADQGADVRTIEDAAELAIARSSWNIESESFDSNLVYQRGFRARFDFLDAAILRSQALCEIGRATHRGLNLAFTSPMMSGPNTLAARRLLKPDAR